LNETGGDETAQHFGNEEEESTHGRELASKDHTEDDLGRVKRLASGHCIVYNDMAHKEKDLQQG